MQMGPGVRQPQVQRPVIANPQLPPVPTGPLRTAGQVGTPIYNPAGPQPRVMSAGTPVTAPVIAPKPAAGPMPAPVMGGAQAPAVSNTGQMPPGQLPMMRR